MKNSNFIVRIPEPCHEDWNKMLPDEKGKFCQSCSKSIFDFSDKTDIEIRDILKENQNQKVCGHFKKSQINRPLNIKVNLNDLPKNMSITKAFAIALFLVFGTLLFSCKDDKGQEVGKIEVVNTTPNPDNMGVLGGISMPENPPQEMIHELVKGDVQSVPITQEAKVSYTETYVDGGISYEEDPILLEEVTVVTEQVPIVESVIMGMMVMDYREEKDSTITPNDSTSQIGQRESNTELTNCAESGFNIYPNPTSGKFTINYELVKRADVKLNIFDVNGSLVKEVVNINSQYQGKYQIPVDLSDLPNGIYIVNLINNGKRTTERIVIER